MIQELLTYLIVILATGYVGYRMYNSIKKKRACDKCGLMEAAKKANGLKNNV